jgi:hypothetical protein
MSSNNTENQQYNVVLKEKEFEIRFYPSATLATVMTTASTYKDVASPGFRKLAGYIFGGNKKKQKIKIFFLSLHVFFLYHLLDIRVFGAMI